MKRSTNPGLLPWPVVSVVFILHFLYFAIFNRYHLVYQEQIQLFRFDWNYFREFLTKPGGLAEYAGAFFIQFYLSSIAGAIIVTSAAIAAFFLVRNILNKLNIFGILWPLIPVLLLAILQSDHIYYIGYTLGFLLAIAFFTIYISLVNNYLRFFTALFGWVLVYMATAGFAILAAVLIIIYELLFVKDHLRPAFVLLFIVLIVLILFIIFQFIYLLPVSYKWIGPVLFLGNVTTKYGLLLLLAYLPVLLVISRIWFKLSKKARLEFSWNRKSVAAGFIVLFAFSVVTAKFAYDYKTELLLGIDNSVRKSEWDRALALSSRSPGANQIVIYLTNIALYKSGLLGDMMFHFNQIGTAGLWLGWGNDASPFFGSEVFYNLGYINEAYRWAFEAMVAKGQAPRLLKRLALTSIINGDYQVAGKYLNVLDQTLFYRKWARHYKRCIEDPEILNHDIEIIEKRQFLVHTDFFADVNHHNIELIRLLENHPDNRMAFEYFMSSLLLEKDINTFAANIYRLREFDFKEIPVHYEEALMVYMAGAKTNIVPEGYTIRESTKQRFNDYLKTYASYSGDPDLVSQYLSKRFGKTFWFYLQFK